MTASATLEPQATLASAETILAAHFTLISQPGSVDHIDIEGVGGWTSSHPHPALSLIRWTTSDEAKAADALAEVLTLFREKGQGFDLMTGPACAANNLLPLLEARGFIKPPLQVAAMAKHIEPHTLPPCPTGMEIRKIEDFGDSRVWETMAAGFDVPSDVGHIFHAAYMAPSHMQTSEIYAASLDGSDTPAGVGYLSYIGDGPGVLLRVSATQEEYRGRGIYRALVARRLFEAAARGRTQAYVHAYSDGSHKALLDMGFTNVGTLQLHRWRP